MYFLAATSWRLNNYFPNQIVITRACFSWPFTPFLVMVKSKILKSSNCLMNSPFATGHFFANLPLTKPFLVQNYNLGSVILDKLAFLPIFWLSKTTKILKKLSKYSLTKHTLSIVLLKWLECQDCD